MVIIINYKVCDQGRGCPCIAACPNDAWYWDEKNQRPAVNNSKCNDCGICTKVCPARVISGALDEEGVRKIKDEVDADDRKRELLFKERFNVEPEDQSIVVDASTFEDEVLKSKDIVIVDFWTPKFSARCKNNTMMYSSLLAKTNKKVVFKKVDILMNKDFCKKIGITTIPALVIYHKGKIIDYIATKIGLAEEDQIKERIAKALNSI
ncbi:MAG: 4Fe-4S binding protein [Candidatus Woesearchaeota archaeon]|nr:MAG: 4Fe-4S binding protein [Candidatus Woesearchaeota archaeon]